MPEPLGETFYTAAESDARFALDADLAEKAGLADANAFSRAQRFAATALADAASVAWNARENQVCEVTLEGNRTLADPTNMAAGATYLLIVRQDATGGRALAFGSAYKFPGGAAPTLTTTANAVDILSFVSDGTSMYGVAQNDFQ